MAAGTISRMGLQEAPIDELQICFKCPNRLSLALWSQREHEDCGNQDTHEAQGYRELIEWVTRDESRQCHHDCGYRDNDNRREEGGKNANNPKSAPHRLYEDVWPTFRSIFPTSVRHNAGPHDAKQTRSCVRLRHDFGYCVSQ